MIGKSLFLTIHLFVHITQDPSEFLRRKSIYTSGDLHSRRSESFLGFSITREIMMEVFTMDQFAHEYGD
jgi:hypothetical protein